MWTRLAGYRFAFYFPVSECRAFSRGVGDRGKRMSKRLAKRVLLLGWDGADWQVIQSLLDQGKMPYLEKLINRGVMGNLATAKPILSPMLWTTIATGRMADQHGIYGFIEPRPDGSGVRPVSSTSIKAPTLWEILESKGLKSAVVGWFASYPADRMPGTVISDMVMNATGKNFDEWKLPPRSVSPERLRDIIAELRVHPSEITGPQILPFLPKAPEIDQKDDKRLRAFANFLARGSTVHSAGTYIAEQEEWDLLAVYYETIDRLSHWFMEYRAPRMSIVSEEDHEIYKTVVDGVYQFHDLVLGRYMELVGEDTTIVICSDHGFYSDHMRPPVSSNMETGNPVMWHRPLGVFLAAGPGIRQDELMFGASIVDLAPTILTMLGLPTGEGMEGRVLNQIFQDPPEASKPEAYERFLPDAADSDEPEDEEDPWAAQEALKQLAELGYIAPPSDDADTAVKNANVQKLANLAEVLMNKREHQRAKECLLELLELQPKQQRAKLLLAQVHLNLEENEDAGAILEEVTRGDDSGPWADVLYGQFLLRTGKEGEALQRLQRAAEAGMRSRSLFLRIGTVFLRRKMWENAESAFHEALDVDPEYAQSLDGLGTALHAQGKHEEGIKYLLQSIGLIYYQPYAHFHLGLALAATGRLRNAMEALNNALKLRPDFEEAKEAIKEVEKALRRSVSEQVTALTEDGVIPAAEPMEDDEALPTAETETQEPAAEPRPAEVEDKPIPPYDSAREIVVVSGLPRSGTSMMMQMLEAGGISVISDGIREADDDNPKGYYELEAVKQMGGDTSWVSDAPGKVVKVIYRLLYELPKDQHYRVVFMNRQLEEVLSSQTTMLDRNDKTQTSRDPSRLISQFQKEVGRTKEWLAKRSNMVTLDIDYNQSIADPTATAAMLNDYFGGTLDTEAMVAAVDRKLYRQRA